MKTLIYSLCAFMATGFILSMTAQVKPKSKKVTELKYSGRIQAQWEGVGSDDSTSKEDRNHFYFRRLFLGGHAKMGDNWGGDIVMDFAASPNSDNTVFIDGASVWYQFDDSFRLDIGQLKVPFGMEETTSSSKLKAIERSAVNRQFAETLKFNARHTGLFAKGSFDGGYSYDLAVVNSGQNHNSKDSGLKDGLYGYNSNELSYYGRLAYANYESELRHSFGVAAGLMEADGTSANDLTAYNIYGSVGSGPVNLDVEYMSGTADMSGGDQEHEGYSAQISYALNNAPIGAWEFLYRYSTVKGTPTSSNLISAKEIVRRANIVNSTVEQLNQHYVGVNYLFNGHDAKLMVGYEINELEEDGATTDADGFRARVQFLF
jgi:phosphate-selective porin OprO and OprP